MIHYVTFSSPPTIGGYQCITKDFSTSIGWNINIISDVIVNNLSYNHKT